MRRNDASARGKDGAARGNGGAARENEAAGRRSGYAAGTKCGVTRGNDGTGRTCDDAARGRGGVWRAVGGVWRFYRDGFRSMTWGRQLWWLVLIKLFVLFAVLRIFFFRPHYEGQSDEQRRRSVATELITRGE